MPDLRFTASDLATIALGLLVVCSGFTATMVVAGTDHSAASSPTVDVRPDTTDPRGVYGQSADARNSTEPIEDAYEEPVPEEGDPYFEAAASDGSWISYVNPRDEYRNPYLGDGSGKICVTLLNEDGDPIVGETVPDTSVTIPTSDSIEWHSSADPLTVDFPLTDHYERPLDADQFGTSSELPQGDGYLDSHCIEVHGLPEDGGTVEYGQAQVDGEYADWIDVVGYVQQGPIGDGWDSSVDPIADAESYEEAGGGWTYRPETSHGQVVVVLQLDPPADAYPDQDAGNESETDDGNESDEHTDNSSDNTDDDNEGDENTDDSSENTDEELPGFGVLVAVTALVVAALARTRR